MSCKAHRTTCILPRRSCVTFATPFKPCANELERTQFEREKMVQDAVARSSDEIVQLKKAIQALRDEMEAMRFDKEKSVQNAVCHRRRRDRPAQSDNIRLARRDGTAQI